MTDPQQIHRAVSSLRRALAPGVDDFGHPDHQDLIAFAESRLGDVDREIVETHLTTCAQCTEDVRDIAEMRAEIAAPVHGAKRTWKYAVAAVAAIAAVLALVVYLRRPDQPASTTEASASPAPSASPRENALSSDEAALVAGATASGRADVPADVRAMTGAVGQMLGHGAATSALLPLAPSGTAVSSASPQFSWRPIANARSYRVAVFDENFREVASSGSITSTTWTPPAPLPAGVTLAWQVAARLPDGSDVLAPAPPRPEARFRVLDAAAAARVAEWRTRLSGQPLALGVLLAQAGLVDEAAREFDRAAAEPSSADLAAKLRASLFR